MIDSEQLHREGYALLRQAIPLEWLAELRAVFDANLKPSQQWPVPRGMDWRHAQLDLDSLVQAVCRLPAVLAVAGELIGERFFLAQVEGREPLAGGGHQQLHRDLSSKRPGDMVNAIAFFDDYGPDNGATRLVPGSHRPLPQQSSLEFTDESAAVQLAGAAGDILVFDVDLVHAGSRNASGARRRSILISYCAQSLQATHLETADLRGVRMDTREQFDPAQFRQVRP
ncbi:phytanoyl-CoA dioxygenase family protein [Pseudomonas sp. H1h]|uniref:phytanoyl-CoA dioxygenase family protein n=1 Tax=Pseudomonas sp. H1h TaxID=1397280 RepID=UPI00046A3556|nr:phytanoyl-CoA dioxygenase family protein [Pseudomonas sp. H1h]